MNAPKSIRCSLLVFGLAFSCASYGQSGQGRESDALPIQAPEPSIQKQDPIRPQTGAEKELVKPPPVGTVQTEPVNPPLTCQTYPDGRTECK